MFFRFFSSAAIMAAFIATAGATPVTVCVPGTLASYVAAGDTGCAVGNYTVSGFSSGGGANPAGLAVPASNIWVNPVLTPTGFYLVFTSSGWTVSGAPGQFVNSVISYVVTAGFGYDITGVGLEFTGSATGTGNPGGSLNYTPQGGNDANLFVDLSSPSANAALYTAQLHVINDLEVNTGWAWCSSAWIAEFVNEFSGTTSSTPTNLPETRTFLTTDNIGGNLL